MKRIVKKPEERRQDIISASRALFLQQGYENTKIQDVMAMLNIAKGTTYHYFKSKEELLDAVIQEMVSEYMQRVETAISACKGNALKKIECLFKAGQVTENLDALHQKDNTLLHVRLLAVTISQLAPLYARVIDQGNKEGVFQVSNPVECAEVLLAGVQFITDNGIFAWDATDLKRRAQNIPKLLETLLNAPKNSFNFMRI